MYKELFYSKVSELNKNGNYREFTEVNRVSSKYPLVKGEYGQEIIVFCSNDYLGMSQDKSVIESMAKGIGIIGGYIAGCLQSIKVVRKRDDLRSALHTNTKRLREKLKANGIEVLKDSTTHILPVIIGDSQKCKEAAKMLFETFNIYVQAINAPTVKKGTERFRINVTPNHTAEQIDLLVSSIVFVFDQLNIKRSVLVK
ncbi:aminotransferase class I/II-fold pyridoxal phosphate-dependent enzyme [Staphylococcus pseudintermedius]|uniref:aminotransferase class I/II-fold pyridoxal phosphate-dependent enzyme n=1 Tax=Staphylococcus pseudintermedius TaxID=283734 RepID=UPI001C1FA7EB|nr:aminotransferase class I/II-fold pyridoxal phosphate-dependent enzyme [Staphylococcus pseudintermedius]EIA5781324.1 aminotransferase class I/II-fold pyridoxal phosphate-dependent enzyme [Staphylococcus pseudintermedius]EII6314922.1 aminotransferase class I/II-fold pyridoxal phosphate-dependent enzyme [Staphylococcus pseudintermedius]MBU7228796.1 aminotransferase class I/II-fold pyridoxal phosphate-dependent enzyme [Staphylococcus pseudintermedius]WQJ44976.1 aminotransferase class I/II-fold p